MTPRRLLLAASTAALILGGALAGPAGAGVQPPHDMVASPNVGPVGQAVTISNAANSPCGGQQGDGPAQVDVTITRPDSSTDQATVPSDEGTGDWEVGYTNTDLVGDYVVTAYCGDIPNVPNGAITAATDFFYTEATFQIVAQVPTTSTTAAPTTTSTAAPAAAVAATAAFTG